VVYLPKYAASLRCIGQALQNRNIEAFELRQQVREFRALAGEPTPPYTGLIELKFSLEDLMRLDHEGQANRGPANREVRFDSLPEVLRAIGEYLDNKRGELRRIDNSGSRTSEIASIEIEYETRNGETLFETLPVGFVREACVRMYKRRSQKTEPISIFARRR
jgi:hypothetical protein